MRRLEAIERRRWTEQLAWLRERLDRLAAGDDEASREAAAQTRRDCGRLQAALGGRTPSAVTGRPDRPDFDDATLRRGLAVDEARHTAANVLTFLDRSEDTDPRRAARWLLRLDVELQDTGFADDDDEFGELALALLRAGASDRDEVVARVRARVAERHARLRQYDDQHEGIGTIYG